MKKRKNNSGQFKKQRLTVQAMTTLKGGGKIVEEEAEGI